MEIKSVCISDCNKTNNLIRDCFKYEEKGITDINYNQYKKDTFKKIKRKKPELIFLDFDEIMIDKLDIFKDFTYKPYVVFILDDEKVHHKIIRYNRLNYFIVDCILRPLNKKKVKKTIERFYDYYRKSENQNEEKIKFNLDTKVVNLYKKDIYYITTCDKYRLIKTKERNYYSNKSLKDLEEKLKDKGFERVHRYFLVNMNKVKKIKKVNYRKIYLYFEVIDKKIRVGKKYLKKF
jgi:DNA-binding LytR/AlgR family response regulator